MKKLILATLASLVLLAVPVSAAHFWEVRMSTPASLINQKTFNVEFVASTTDPAASITVQLYQNNNPVSGASKSIAAGNYGGSGAFQVTVPSDGTYNYHLKATSGGEEKTTAQRSVTVDTTPPATPVYHGVSRSGNTYTLTFTVPSDGDVAEIRIYSSPNRSFTADGTTQVGFITVNPGETRTFTYTASDSQQRFHAIQAFDNAGNFSALSADRDTTVTQGTPAPVGVTADQGEVTEGASTETDDEAAQEEGEVLSEEDSEDDGAGWVWIVAAVVAVGLGYYLLIARPNRAKK